MSRAVETPLTVDQATQTQRIAASPSGTRLASANAGSGKTKVLVDRVSRILLRGIAPEDILCLTYTKAAAAEMQTRLFSKLGDWSIMDEDGLRAELTKLFGGDPAAQTSPIDLASARKLFAKALETPEGLKVQTIHAFCERILSRFPIEAGIYPGFEPLDDAELRAIRAEVYEAILIEASEDRNGSLAQSLANLTLEKADITLQGVFDWMAYSPGKLARWQAGDPMADLRENLGLGNVSTQADVCEAFAASLDRQQMAGAADILENSKLKGDQRNAALFREILASDDAQENYARAADRLLTQAGKLIANWNAKSTDVSAALAVDQFAAQFLRARDQALSVKVLELTSAVFAISKRYAPLYEAAKRARRGLDYSDQILLVRALLQDSLVAQWVRYKLDGGIEHILLDEAQDTSGEQWEIIQALTDAFDQDDPNRDPKNPRTFFAVGDEKQSIYGFQGADPDQFLRKITDYAQDGGMGVRMRMSFRSAQDVLDVVDQLFVENRGLQRMFDAELTPEASEKVRHVAQRNDRGLVELWPLVPRPEDPPEEVPWDTTPIDRQGLVHQKERLAENIAAQIRTWLDQAEPIFDRDLKTTRPVHPGDILILVSKRNDLFDAIIRALKAKEIPVAGADRLKLQEAVIVKDLLALTRFVLLPSDDLSLAEVLKSPIFGWDDDALFAAAEGREGALWDALKTRNPDTAQVLERYIDLSKRTTPHGFYQRVLDDLDALGISVRKRFYGRLSREAQEALEAFLGQAMEYQIRQAPSLHRFLAAFEGNEVEIKRDMEAATQEVRVMTVHGAKGLEAPIVFLPDTTSVPSVSDMLLPDGDDFVWRPKTAEQPERLQALQTRATQKIAQERLRLLYVAMTRAESRLVVCGHVHARSKTGMQEGCWYEWIASAFAGLEITPIETPVQADGEAAPRAGLRYGGQPEKAQSVAETRSQDAAPLPKWAFELAAIETHRNKVTPSHLLSDPQMDVPVRSPSRAAQRFERGNIIHKLLEVLPEFTKARRAEIARRILAKYRQLDAQMRDQLMEEVFAVLDNPNFAQVFAPGSRAEVSLAGTAKTLPEGLYLNAQIDRLCVTETEVLIVDYKSNRPPPARAEDVADLYLGQMAAYRELAKELYPARAIRCALLWTDIPALMVLPNALLDDALQKVRALPI